MCKKANSQCLAHITFKTFYGQKCIYQKNFTEILPTLENGII